MAKIKVYHSSNCPPCEQIKKIIEEKHPEISLVDIDTDEGFQEFFELVLAKKDGAVPSAFKEGEQCKILVSEDDISISCPSDEAAPENEAPTE